MTATLLAALPGISTVATATAPFTDNYSRRFPAQWLERNGEIQLDSLCYNYPSDSHMYRFCREQAVQTLQGRCTRYRALTNEHTGDTKIHYQRLAHKYCTAKERYTPDTENKKEVDVTE